MKADILIHDLKDSIDDMWTNCINSINTLVYDREEYGLMQQEEIREILKSLSMLKNQVDYLAEECTTMPADLKRQELGS